MGEAEQTGVARPVAHFLRRRFRESKTMTYKGNDLDLRPRPSAPAAARDAPGPTERTAKAPNGAAPHPASPIAVDDAVLACCNCAYDVARFHASEDVRLEHLLHALTRVGAAVEALAEL